MSDNTFTWGVIGPGNIASTFADDLAHIHPVRHRIGAVLSHSLEKAADFADKEDAPRYFDNLELFVQDAKVDAVYIATPHPLHYEATLQCLQNRLPVLCEKPMGMNQRQVQEMIDAAARHQTFLLEGMWVRFLPSIRKVLELVDEGAIGKVLSVRADLSFKAPEEPDSRYFDPEKGGGSLLDLGIYPVFLAHLLLGKPTGIRAYAQLTSQQIDEACVAILEYSNEAYATIESSLVIQTANTASIYGEKGRILIDTQWNEKPSRIVLTHYEGDEQVFPCAWKGHGLQFEAEEVCRCVRANQLYSEHFCHSFSLDLVSTLDAIRHQTGIIYPADKKINSTP
ncbi:Gfo/Idh/MocA family protein [Paraflavitalea pollutisoli]|uniref:Gfo/Idh/MocA family protein n=1 Tax=Paraflavitalea pollutisoli TaxID=3034143 RepID=UPI0023EC5029|nr:Gfo/Idh/MocA family oxidoreductase [Paraflavitalea sp. H1-2-19X]